MRLTKRIPFFFCCLAMALLLPVGLRAQNPTTEGTDFWLTFMQNYNHLTYDNTLTMTILISSKNRCSATVTNPANGWTRTVNVVPGTVTQIDVPWAANCYNLLSDYTQPRPKGLHITSTDKVSVYASNFATASYDITNILPTPTLQDEYMLQSYGGSPPGSNEFVVMAVEDNTTFTLKASCSLNNGSIAAGTTRTFTLNRGQCRIFYAAEMAGTYSSRTNRYTFSNTQLNNWRNGRYDISGTVVKADNCKKLAVFMGNSITFIPYDVRAGDHIVEQAIPVAYWGTKFVVTPSMMRNYDIFRVTSLENNNQVRINGVLQAVLQAGQTAEFNIYANEIDFVETTKPASVFIYLIGGEYSPDYGNVDHPGDPSFAVINPIEQQVSEITFGAYRPSSGTGGFYHYVNIATETANVPGMTLDGTNIAGLFNPVPGTPYSFARIQITASSHTLKAQSGGFVAHIYGIGRYESYAYSVGSSAIDLNRQLFIADDLVADLEAGSHQCNSNDIPFHLQTNIDYLRLIWNFGDGTPEFEGGPDQTHRYRAVGEYNASIIMETPVARCGTGYDTIPVQIHIHPPIMSSITETICESGQYPWAGGYINQRGIYTQLNLIDQYGCDSSVTLTLNVLPDGGMRFQQRACDAFTWQTAGSLGHGTGATYTTSGTYIGPYYANAGGCTGYDTLDLIIDYSTNFTDVRFACDRFVWSNGNHYTESNHTSQQLLRNAVGCDSIVYLDLTLGRSNNWVDQHDVCDTFTWQDGIRYTNSNNTAQLHYTNRSGCDSTVQLSLSVRHSSPPTNIDTSVCDTYLHTSLAKLFTTSTRFDTLMRNQQQCDSVLHLNVTVRRSTIADTLRLTACDSFTWNFSNQRYTLSNTYTHTRPGGNVSGCDSTMTLSLTINPSSDIHINKDTCDFYTWPATSARYTVTSDHSITRRNQWNCDSTTTLHLTLRHSTRSDQRDTACDSYTWHGHTMTVSSLYHDTLTNTAGCDSLMSMQLKLFFSHSSDTIDTAACDRFNFHLDGYSYTDDAILTGHLRTTRSCDSTAIYRLHILKSIIVEEPHHACNSFFWSHNLRNYTTSQHDTIFGRRKNGCDSLTVLNLTVDYTTYSPLLFDTACNEYTWSLTGQRFTSSRRLTEKIRSSADCDSIVQLDLTVWHNDTVYIPHSACNNYFWFSSGRTYTSSTRDTVWGSNRHQCDSLTVLQLTIFYNDTIHLDDTTCSNQPYPFAGENYTTPGIYNAVLKNQHSCDSVLSLHLTVWPAYDYPIFDSIEQDSLPYDAANGTQYWHDVRGDIIHLTSSHQCDSIQRLHLFVLFRLFNCDEMLQFPNLVTPNGDGDNDVFSILGLENGCWPHNELRIYNRWGKTVFTAKDIEDGAAIWNPINLPPGTYYYSFRAHNPQHSTERHGVIEVVY